MLWKKNPNKICGIEIDSNFAAWLKVGAVIDDPEYTDTERIELVLRMVFGDVPTDFNTVELLFQGCIDFYLCEIQNRGLPPAKERLYDWKKDFHTIWADFKIYAQIDLCNKKTKLHWWDFYYLFLSLPSHSRIKSLISDRGEDESDYCSKGQEKMREKIHWRKVAAAVDWQPGEEYEDYESVV